MFTISYLFESAKPELKPGEHAVPHINKERVKDLNPKTGRMKTFKRTRWIKSKIPPEQRTMKNIPRFSDGKLKVRFQDWLQIKSQKVSPENKVNTWGWSSNGKCYGWSHRAMHGFSIGEEIKPTTCGFEGLKKPFKIKDRAQCEEVAKRFARSIS